MASIYVEEKKKLKGIRGMLLAITITNLLLTLVMNIVSSFYESSELIYLQAFAVGLGAYLIPIAIYAFRNKITATAASEKFCLRGCAPQLLILAAFMGIGCQFAQIAVNLPFSGVGDGSAFYAPTSIGELVLAFGVIALMPAVFEEFLFRGIVYCSMAELNKKAALIFSSVMFAVMHGNVNSLLGYLLMGFSAAYLVSGTESLFAAVIFHFVNNATALLLAYFNDALWYLPKTMILLFVFGLTVFFICIAVLFRMAKQMAKNTAAEAKSGRRINCAALLGQSFVSLPVILCIAFTIAGGILIKTV